MDEFFSGFVPSVQLVGVVKSRWTSRSGTIAADAPSGCLGRWIQCYAFSGPSL